MFLRFIGVSDEFLNAAGPAAMIPSRIGSEREAVLGSTLPNGTAVGDTTLGAHGDIDGDALEKLIAGGGSDGAGSSSSSSDGKATAGAGLGGSAIEGLVNASSAIVLVLIMLVAFAGFLCLRRKFGTRNTFNRRDGGGWGALGNPLGPMSSSSAAGGRGSKRHSRVDSLGRGGGMGLGRGTGETPTEDEQELDELMRTRARGGVRDEEDRIEGKGKGKVDSEIFDLGAEDDDDDEDEDEDEDDVSDHRKRYR